MALTYAERLEYSTIIQKNFTEIKNLKIDLLDAVNDNNVEAYNSIVSTIYAKASLAETALTGLKNLYLERLDV